MTSVLCIGDIAVDFYVTLSRMHVGGISFNVAWNIRECGADAHVCSAIGTDEDGTAVLRALLERNVPRDAIFVRDGRTAQQRILINSEGERIFDGYRAGVLSTLSPADLDAVDISRFHALYIPLSDGLESLFEAVARDVQGITKVADLSADGPNPGGLRAAVSRYAESFDLLFIGGQDEDRSHVAEIARRYPDKVLVLTLGSKGAVALHGEATFEQAAMTVEHVVDTTGCGDGFQGAFIAHWLSNRDDIPAALRAGVTQGAKVASFLGATQCVIEGV